MYDVEHLGQVFTPQTITQQLISLRQNQGSILEPSAGDGAFFHIPGIVGIEIDSQHCPPGCLNIDFFDYSVDNKFDTIIGNPPYVGYKKILSETKKKLNPIFDNRTNLYMFFIEKCLKHLTEHGEIIFITPRDFIKATSAIPLNNILWQQGTITHFFDLGDNYVFKGYSPNCAIWRFEKNNFTRQTKTNEGIKKFTNINGQLCFTNNEYTIDFIDFVKVGAVSGCDEIFTHPEGNMEFVCSYTKKTKQTKRMFYNIKNDYLSEHKERLISRKIKKFDESNWWMWGRDYYKSDAPRVYVNCKTREKNPFFTHPCRNYDGSVLAVFVNISEDEAVARLNQINWQELGFKVGGRYIFSQRTLYKLCNSPNG